MPSPPDLLDRVGGLSGVMFALYQRRPGRVVLPDVCCDLVWTGDRLSLSGPMSRSEILGGKPGQIELLNIDPLVARAVFGVPLEALTDISVAIEDLAPDLAGPLSELFFQGRGAELVGRAVQAPAPDGRLVRAAAALSDGGQVSWAAEIAALSERQLARRFQDAFGLSPVLYRRIQRFRKAIMAIRLGSSLADAAIVAGYADQPHFTRDVRDLTGHTPVELVRNAGSLDDVTARTREY